MRSYEFTNLYEAEMDEASRAGSAITLGEIPAKYKGLKVLGRGTTTLALDLDEDHVLLITRDSMKLEWLESEGMAQRIESFEARNHIRGMSELPVYVLKCRKLIPLSPENKKIVRKLVKEFENVKQKHFNYRNPDMEFQAIVNHFSENEKHALYPLMSFLSNYDHSQFHFDLGHRNFMQTKEGEIVVLDPVVSSEIMTLIRDNQEAKYRNQNSW